MIADDAFDAEENGRIHADLREQISRTLLDRLTVIAADTVALFPFGGDEALDAAYCSRVGALLVRLLAYAVRDGRVDGRGSSITDLSRMALERALSTERIFTFVYLTERTALDELALDETIGATSEPWAVAAQLVRRASFELLAAYTGRAQLEPTGAAITDRLTTLYTRQLFDAVLAKEIERAGRFGYSISIILFDVDQLSRINKDYGYGVGDKILERLGILMRQYFRQHDWVARYAEDSIAVLLIRTDSDDAGELAERVRRTVDERLGFRDHLSEQPVAVTVSAANINVQVAVGDLLDPERLMADAEAAVERAKQLGRNRVERMDEYSATRALSHNPPSA